MSKYSLALISPGREGSVVSGRWKGLVNFYRLTLPLLTGLTPSDRYSIKVFDECVDTVPAEQTFDLVGISAMTPYSPRAYDLSQQFRSNGAAVVMGGQHATLMPDEVARYVDSVVIGDAEDTWPRVLRDFESDRLKSRYVSDGKGLKDNTARILPDRSEIARKSLLVFATVETSRGCPYVCDYCTIASFYKASYSRYSIDTVMEDIEGVSGKNIFFVDDNFIGGSKRHRDRVKEFLRALKDLDKRWFCQSTIMLADDAELLRLAADAGCAGVYLGLESISHSSLKEVNKAWNRPDSFVERIKRIRDHGIAIEAGFIFGFDHDTPSVFENTAEFVEQTGVESPNAHILTPYPGTPLYQRFAKDGRLITRNWKFYNTGHVVFKPAQMSVDELRDGYVWWYENVFSPSRVARRIYGANFRRYTSIVNCVKAVEVKRSRFKTGVVAESSSGFSNPYRDSVARNS